MATRRDLLKAALGSAVVASVGLPRDTGARERSGELWLIRHAESLINVAPRPDQPDEGVSYPLTRAGIQQAKALAKALRPSALSSLYSSTRLRAIQTADAISLDSGIEVQLAPEMVEIGFGDLGKIAQTPEAIRKAMADLYQNWLVRGEVDARIEGGESYRDLTERSLLFLERMFNQIDETGRDTVVVSHGALIMAMGPSIAQNVSADFALRNPLANASIVKFRRTGGKVVCTRWAGLVPS